jgi:hypothetical protein
MGANQSITNPLHDEFEIVDYYDKQSFSDDKQSFIDDKPLINDDKQTFSEKVKMMNSTDNSQITVKKPIKHYSKKQTFFYETQGLIDLLDDDDSIPNFKHENRLKREKKIRKKKENHFILKYNNFDVQDVNKEVEMRFNHIINMRSFNDLETYLRQMIVHYHSVCTHDHRNLKK